MTKRETNNKTIAKNTIALYIREIVSLIITIVTAGIMFKVLGATDFGIFNVVGGIVTMVAFLTGSLASGAQRFLSYDIGRGDENAVNETFNVVALSYFLLGFIVFLFAEIGGVWFLNTHMTIPEERLIAANWILQCSILQFIIGITTSPYSAAVIAYERMGTFAYVGIINEALRLIVLFLIVITPFDKLIVLSLLHFAISAGQQLFYQWYCRSRLNNIHFQFVWNAKKMKSIIGYSGWNMIGSFATVLHTNGVNILLNVFFDPTINAARGIAYRINSAVYAYTGNYYMAVRPQITKTYAAGDLKRMHKLIFSSSRLAFYLMLVLCIPISLNIKQILQIWLGTPPDYATIFVQLVFLNALLEIYSLPLTAGIQATGKIKIMQLTVSTIYLLIVPISYFLLKLGAPPESTFWVNNTIVVICLLPRLYLCQKQYGLSMYSYFWGVFIRTLGVAAISYLICKTVVSYIADGVSVFRFILAVGISFVITIVIVYILGITDEERSVLKQYISKRLHRNKTVCK